MFDKNTYDLRCELPKEIDEDFIMEIYQKLSLKEECPRWDDKSDPEKLLRLSAGAWTASLWLDNCCVKEVRDDGVWVVCLYGLRGGNNRVHEDHPDWPEKAAYPRSPGHWVLKKNRKPHWLDYRIPHDPNFDEHALIDLHFHFLKQAQESKIYQVEATCINCNSIEVECECDEGFDWEEKTEHSRLDKWASFKYIRVGDDFSLANLYN